MYFLGGSYWINKGKWCNVRAMESARAPEDPPKLTQAPAPALPCRACLAAGPAGMFDHMVDHMVDHSQANRHRAGPAPGLCHPAGAWVRPGMSDGSPRILFLRLFDHYLSGQKYRIPAPKYRIPDPTGYLFDHSVGRPRLGPLNLGMPHKLRGTLTLSRYDCLSSPGPKIRVRGWSL